MLPVLFADIIRRDRENDSQFLETSDTAVQHIALVTVQNPRRVSDPLQGRERRMSLRFEL
jgi:hypothetical protein